MLSVLNFPGKEENSKENIIVILKAEQYILKDLKNLIINTEDLSKLGRGEIRRKTHSMFFFLKVHLVSQCQGIRTTS